MPNKDTTPTETIEAVVDGMNARIDYLDQRLADLHFERAALLTALKQLRFDAMRLCNCFVKEPELEIKSRLIEADCRKTIALVADVIRYTEGR